VFTGWTAGTAPWLRRHDLATAGALTGQLKSVAGGQAPQFGLPVAAPLLLVCAHGRRDVCCARLGGPLARRLARTWPAEVWETTHVGGHRFAANLVILPHGLYYGPVAGASAERAVAAYQRGEVALDRYRGRAGQPGPVQRGDYLAMKAGGGGTLTALT
jgi:hypothetical protein